MLELDKKFAEAMSEYGFCKKRKHYFIRKQGECLQYITIQETRIRGESKVHITVSVGFNYENLNKRIYELQNKEYDDRWATANISLAYLMRTEKPYGFYLDENSNLEEVAEDIKGNITEYALDFWESCNTLEKFRAKLQEEDEIVRMSTMTHMQPEWNLRGLTENDLPL